MVKPLFTAELLEEENETLVEKWDWNAVKNALDDSARKYITTQKDFKEDHRLMDGRLVISTLAVLFSLYAIGYDYLKPFPESKLVLIVCVVLYFIAIGILTLYTTYIEKGTFASAKHTADKITYWKFSSKQKPHHEHVYVLSIEVLDVNTNKIKTSNHELSIAKYFDENGKLVSKALYNDLCKFCTSISAEDKKTK